MTQRVSEQFARDFLSRLHEAVNAHDAQAVAQLCTPDVVWTDPAASKPLEGRAAVYGFHRHVMFRALPDVRVELIDGPYLSPDSAAVAVRLRISGTMDGPLVPPGFAPTRGRVEFESAEFSHFRDGLLAQHVVVLNMLELARTIGAAPPAGSLAERVGVWAQHVAAYVQRLRRAEST